MPDFEHSRFGPDEADPPYERRRAVDPAVEMIVHKIVGMESRIGDRVGLLLEDHKKEMRLELKNEIRNLVPGGDIEGHRKAHEQMIASADRWQRFRYAMFEHVSKSVFLAGLFFLGLAVWEYFKRGVMQ